MGSWLLPAAVRPHVAIFYAFARAIDDIADSPSLSPDDKIARLTAFERTLSGTDDAGPGKAVAMRQSLRETGIPAQHCFDLIAAFKQDAVKNRYDDFNDLLGYCILSAAPVGRYLIDLHGGSLHGYGPSDNLCMALQIINHLQDCRDDYRTLDRVYLPRDWMAAEGVRVEDLDKDAASLGLRRVLDRTLDATEALLSEARLLPVGLVSRRLAMEAAGILAIADRLVALLRRRDPLPRRVVLGKAGYAAAILSGIGRGMFRRS